MIYYMHPGCEGLPPQLPPKATDSLIGVVHRSVQDMYVHIRLGHLLFGLFFFPTFQGSEVFFFCRVFHVVISGSSSPTSWSTEGHVYMSLWI